MAERRGCHRAAAPPPGGARELRGFGALLFFQQAAARLAAAGPPTVHVLAARGRGDAMRRDVARESGVCRANGARPRETDIPASFLLAEARVAPRACPSMPVNLPTNLLRSFVAIVETGSMLNATEQVFVTQSALSLQIKRLEELVQRPLFSRESRRLVLTTAGDVLLDYARRVLRLHDEAVAAVTSGHFVGPVRVGMVQDFADTLLAGVLARFAELHPDTQISARVAGTVDLMGMLDRHLIDVVVGFSGPDDPNAVSTSAMAWFGQSRLLSQSVLPLAILEKPCRFREAALASLDAAGRRHRIAVETPNLSTLRAAVQAGLGLTCRTHAFLHDLATVPPGALPPLPNVSCIVVTGARASEATSRLAELATEVLREPVERDAAVTEVA
jgi:DNA-binding transcriptional LysR family regulator